MPYNIIKTGPNGGGRNTGSHAKAERIRAMLEERPYATLSELRTAVGCSTKVAEYVRRKWREQRKVATGV
jgi:hypothetical protein